MCFSIANCPEMLDKKIRILNFQVVLGLMGLSMTKSRVLVSSEELTGDNSLCVLCTGMHQATAMCVEWFNLEVFQMAQEIWLGGDTGH